MVLDRTGASRRAPGQSEPHLTHRSDHPRFALDSVDTVGSLKWVGVWTWDVAWRRKIDHT